MASAISPKMIFAANPGRGRIVGRLITLPSISVNYLLFTGLGAVRLTGPESDSCFEIN